MSTKKNTGNRWATAVEGAADILLDTGKSNEGVIGVPQEEKQLQGTVVTTQEPEKKKTRRHAAKREDAKPFGSEINKKAAVSTGISDSADAPIVPQASAKKAMPDILSGTSVAKEVDEGLLQPLDLIQQALTMKGRRSSGGRQRTYYIDNDIADKITSLAKELDKSESQLLREVLRAVFKMNEQ